MGQTHMLTPNYEDNLGVVGAPAAIAEPAGAGVTSKRPMYFVVGLILVLVLVSLLYSVAEKE